MNVATIEMPVDEAQDQLVAYKEAVKRRHDDEMAMVLKGYKELAKGNALIKLSETMRQSGVDEEGMPRLAVCRADERWCQVELYSDGAATFKGFKVEGWKGDQDHRAPSRKVAIGPRVFPDLAQPWLHVSRKRKALVPFVPAPLRPVHHLRNYHILWEAEWQPTPPKDPYLLKRIGGDLFTVLASWDLTEIERAVLAGRLEA